jgi:hypothetical protein
MKKTKKCWKHSTIIFDIMKKKKKKKFYQLKLRLKKTMKTYKKTITQKQFELKKKKIIILTKKMK